ncbi:hypothetical protein [Lactobacillus taiwanensis]|uniref:hypothetical protein n=1 Tax=Lactobacillus taiwanensis TaxID=508451 RepID=UPI00321FC2CC
MEELKTELTHGKSQLYLAGVVKITKDTFEEEKTSKSGYTYLRTSFSVKVGEGRSVWVSMMGGYSKGNPVVYTFSNKNESLQINWKNRDNSQVLEQVADYSLFKIALEKDNEGKLITKKFVSEYDAINYLKDHLEDGMNVVISAEADYSLYNDDVQRQFKVRTLALDEGYTDKEKVKHEHRDPAARLSQTYLIEEDSISENYEEELEENGVTTINAYVPQYLGKVDGKELKKVVALPQQFTVRVKDDNVEGAKALVGSVIKPESSDAVREISMRMNILDGYSTSQVQLEEDDLPDEVKQLIEVGAMSLEDVKRETYVSGDKVSETTFSSIMLDKESRRILKEDKYDLSVLTMPIVDGEETVDSDDDSWLEAEAEDDEVDFNFE